MENDRIKAVNVIKNEDKQFGRYMVTFSPFTGREAPLVQQSSAFVQKGLPFSMT